MSNWVAVKDPTTGKTYYANMVTRETTWDVPDDFQGTNEPEVQYNPQSQLSMNNNNNNYGNQGGYGMGGNQQQQQQQQYGGNPQQQYSQYNQQNYGYSQQNFNDPYGQQQGYGGGYGMGGMNMMQGYGQQQQQQPQSQYGNMGMQQQPQQQQQQQPQPKKKKVKKKQSQVSQPQGNDDYSDTKWRKAHDPQSGKYYWYHIETKETTWDMPDELKPREQAKKRLSAQMAISQNSMVNFSAAWADDDDDDNDDNKNNNNDGWSDDDDDDDDSSDSDGLEQYNGASKKIKGNINTNVVDEPSSTDDDDDGAGMQNLGDDDEVLIEDTSNKFWTIGSTKSENFPISNFGDKYFQHDKHKTGLFKKPSSLEMLKFNAYKKVTHALRKMDNKMDKQAQQMWKNINSYIGTRKSSKDDSGHVEKLLRFALKAPEELRDEAYLQLIKQTNGNPMSESLIKCWKLLAICASIFPPSDEFASYLAVYLFKSTKSAGAIGQYSTFALQALDRTMEVGQRRIQPMDLEIQRIEERQPIPVKIYFLDGTFRTLLVTSQTRAQQVEDALGDVLRLTHKESFGVFEMEEPRPGWSKDVYEKRAKLDRQQKIDDLQYMPLNRELETNERIMDVFSSWQRSNKKKNRTIRFVYRCKLHSKAQEVSYSKNGWKIAFLTVTWHVMHGMYPMDEKDALIAGAIQLQATHGIQDASFYVSGVIVDVIEKYVPWQLLSKFKPSDLEYKILQHHVNFKHLDKTDCYRRYLKHLRESTASVYFGCEYFRCVRVSRIKTQNAEKIDLILGINENGVLFLEPVSKKIVERYKMEEILTYGFRSNAFLFVAGTLMTQRKYQFATMLGKQMNDLLRSHIDLRVQQAEVQGYQMNNNY